MTTKLKQAFASGKFVVSGEVGPPKGTNIDEMLQHIDLLKDKVDALNVTDNQSSVMRISSLCRVQAHQRARRRTHPAADLQGPEPPGAAVRTA